MSHLLLLVGQHHPDGLGTAHRCRVASIVREHGGTIACDSERLRGTTFTVGRRLLVAVDRAP